MVRFFLINLVLGAAVLGSYVHGITSHPSLIEVDALYGTMPAWVHAIYDKSMLVAAVAYFPPFVLFMRHRDATVFGGRSIATVDALYVLVLLPSILWMPLTFAWMESGSLVTWYLMRTVLALVAIGSYLQLAAIWTMAPRANKPLFVAALVGQALFTVQTGLLDPWIWPMFFDPANPPG